LPPELHAGCAALKGRWVASRGIHSNSPGSHKCNVHHHTEPGLAARISLLSLDSTLLSDPNFLIVFEHAGRRESAVAPAQHAALAEFSRLTPRERELADLASEGKSNGEIATALGCSVAAVKNGLYTVFKKVGVASRTQLMRKLAA
jgi:DNA-binding CsgD family transcriptional regulator